MSWENISGLTACGLGIGFCLWTFGYTNWLWRKITLRKIKTGPGIWWPPTPQHINCRCDTEPLVEVTAMGGSNPGEAGGLSNNPIQVNYPPEMPPGLPYRWEGTHAPKKIREPDIEKQWLKGRRVRHVPTKRSGEIITVNQVKGMIYTKMDDGGLLWAHITDFVKLKKRATPPKEMWLNYFPQTKTWAEFSTDKPMGAISIGRKIHRRPVKFVQAAS